MKRKWNAAVTGFCIFLVFMGICTVVAKGIYASGLPRVTLDNPSKKSISHEISAGGTVLAGAELGVYVESGLRVAQIMVRSGQTVEAGDALFQIDTSDLQDIIDTKKLELGKLQAQEKEAAVLADNLAQEEQKNLDRAGTDADRQVLETESEYNRKRLAVTQAQKALDNYQAYLSGSVSGGDGESQQARNEKLQQLEQAVGNAAYDAEQARLKYDAAQSQAREARQDAARKAASYSAARESARLEAERCKAEIEGLQELLAAQGYVYADVAGVVTAQKLAVGERTPDTACLLYAPETENRIVELTLGAEETKYVSLGDTVRLAYRVSTGESRKVEAPIAYMENSGDSTKAEIYLEDAALSIGQMVSMDFVKQSEAYEFCVPLYAVHSDGAGGSFVYTVEERQGFLGTEWHLRKLAVTVLDKNASDAAIEGVGIDAETNILLSADKDVADGTVVRITK